MHYNTVHVAQVEKKINKDTYYSFINVTYFRGFFFLSENNNIRDILSDQVVYNN